MGISIGTGWSLASAALSDLDSFAATAINFESRTTAEINVPALNTPAGPMPKLYGDLFDAGNLSVPGYLDTLRDFEPSTDLGALTITARQLPGETAPATYVGNAQIIGESKAVPVEDVCTQELTIGWENGYTFTAATTGP